jgi:hypothetical protein
MLVPSGLHDASASVSGSNVSCVSAPLSTFIAYRSKLPLRLLSNAMYFPSGDQSACLSVAGSKVSRVCPAPVPSIT